MRSRTMNDRSGMENGPSDTTGETQHGDAAAQQRDARVAVAERVRAFYAGLPFNFHTGVESASAAVQANPVGATYPDLHALLSRGGVRRALELGCGAGWLTNSLAQHYGVEMTAVDFCAPALERAREVARLSGVQQRTRFIESDLFDFKHDEPFDLVLSMGVLHHTGDAAGGVRHAASFVAPAGHLYIGLYHAPGRRVFLDALQGLAAREGEDAAFRRYREIDTVRQYDETLMRSWFRDQVLHPHETQHTLRETVAWFTSAGIALESTSINRFQPLGELEALFALELTYAERSRRALEVEKRYFPGFFTACGRRVARPTV